jgi:hypothetical protein
MKRIIAAVLTLILILVVTSTVVFAVGDKVQERNPEFNGDVDVPVQRQLIVNGDV